MNYRFFRPALCVLFLSLPVTALQALEPAWVHTLEDPAAARPVVDGDQILIAGGNELVSLSQDGSVEWTYSARGKVLSTVALGEDRMYLHSSSGLTALNSDQEEVWHYDAEDRGAMVDGRTWGWGEGLFSDPWAYYRSSPMLTESALVFGSSNGVRALDPEAGELLWAQPSAPVTADIVQIGDGVLVPTWGNRLWRLNIANGSPSWSFDASIRTGGNPRWMGWNGLNLTPVVHDGQVLLGSRGTFFFAINGETGKETWSNKHGTSWIGSAGVLRDGHVYFGLSDGKGIVGINIPSGNQTLFVPALGAIFATPVIHENYLVAGTLRGELLVVDLDEGRLLATHQLQDSPKGYNEYFQPDPDSTLTPYEFTVERMNVMKREQKSILSMAVVNDLLVVGTGSGEVFGFNLADLTGSD